MSSNNNKNKRKSKIIVICLAPLLSLPFFGALKAAILLSITVFPKESNIYINIFQIAFYLILFSVAILLYIKLLKRIFMFFEQNNPF